MIETFLSRLFQLGAAFESPVTVWTVAVLASLLAVAPLIIFTLDRLGRLQPALRRELYTRYLSWLVLVPLMLGPVLAGPGVTMLAVGALSLLCYREFSRATGAFRDRLVSLVVVLGILALTFAVYDHWYGLFVALPSLTIALIAIVGLADDRPDGYIQRIAMGILCFLMFGFCFGHLGYMANDRDYRPIILMILVCVEMNDIFAFICGKLFGRIKFMPNTSPNKTLGGALGALVLTTALCAFIGHFIFRGTELDTLPHLIAMGALISLVGQFGDLVLSSIKRDLGIKDMGATIPGHGGLLDRFDSLIFVAPALFHYIGYFRGFGLDRGVRIMTGGG